MTKHIQNFLLILAAAIAGSFLGSIFAVILSFLSPELIMDLFGAKLHPVRFSASMGMIWGLFIGAGAMSFCMAITAIATIGKAKKK